MDTSDLYASAAGRARRAAGAGGRLAPGLLRRVRAGLCSRDGVVGAAVALGVAGVLLLAVRGSAVGSSAAQRDRLHQAVGLAASVIQADLSRSLAAADALDALVRGSSGSGGVDQLDRVVAGLRQRFPLLASVALAPGGVVRQASPPSPAPAVVGQRLFDDAATRTASRLALRQRQMAIGLVPGAGQALVVNGYQPVYRRSAGPDPAASGPFWGLVVVSVRLPELAPYLSAARIDPSQVRAELVPAGGPARTPIATPPVPGDTPAQASAVVHLPGHDLVLRVVARPAWFSPGWAAPGAVLAGLLCGVACTTLLRQRRRRATRRRYAETSQMLAGCSGQFDDAHAQLDALRHTRGMAVLVAVRLPATGTYQRPGAAVAPGEQRDWSGLIHAFKRDGDLLLHLQGGDFLLAAHSLPGRGVAARVRRRLHHQLQEVTALACGPQAMPVLLQSVLFEPAVTEPGAVLARLLQALYAPDPPVVPAADGARPGPAGGPPHRPQARPGSGGHPAATRPAALA